MQTIQQQPPAPSQAAKAHVHVSIPLSWFVVLVSILVVMSFIAGWFVPSPFFKLAAGDKHNSNGPKTLSFAGPSEIPVKPQMTAAEIAAVVTGDEIRETPAG